MFSIKSIFNGGCFENTNLLAMFGIRQMEDGHPVCEAKDLGVIQDVFVTLSSRQLWGFVAILRLLLKPKRNQTQIGQNRKNQKSLLMSKPKNH